MPGELDVIAGDVSDRDKAGAVHDKLYGNLAHAPTVYLTKNVYTRGSGRNFDTLFESYQRERGGVWSSTRFSARD